MLVVEIADLRRGPVRVAGQLSRSDPALKNAVGLVGPIQVTGVLTWTGDEQFYWRGGLAAPMEFECGRCLGSAAADIEVSVEALFTHDPDVLDDPSVYPLAQGSTSIDLRPAVCEELILAAPAFPICREDCRGLCRQCGNDLNEGSCDCRPELDARWGPLLQTIRPKAS